MGPLARFRFRRLAVNSLMKSGYDRRQALNVIEEMRNEDVDAIVTQVAVAHGKADLTAAIGDGVLLDKILQFLNEHWDEIFALLLKLIGIAL